MQGRKVRIDTPDAVRRAAEQVVRDAFHGRRPSAEAAALVSALRDLALMRATALPAGDLGAGGAR